MTALPECANKNCGTTGRICFRCDQCRDHCDCEVVEKVICPVCLGKGKINRDKKFPGRDRILPNPIPDPKPPKSPIHISPFELKPRYRKYDKLRYYCQKFELKATED